MNPTRRAHIRIQAELDSLARMEILSPEQVQTLKERYPVTAWNVMALVRTFTVLGILTAITGIVVLMRSCLYRWLMAILEWLSPIFRYLNWWIVAELGLAVIGLGLLVLGYRLCTRKTKMVAGEAAELAGSLALQGLTVVLAAHYSTGSDAWPNLAGIQTVMLVLIAYLVTNRYVLWYACAMFFFWFGAETGYMSGWGCYWLGMTYPVRFLGAGIVTLGLAWLHGKTIRGRWAPFSRVYLHFGMLIINLALWFLALFGYFENHDIRWDDTEGERLLFALLWAAVSGASLFAGAKYGIKLLRGYGMTFLIINIYTFYFEFVCAHSGELWFIHMLLVGGSLVWLGSYLEKKRHEDKGQSA